tara:strand:- start:340 stop:483 length:144 start_codon:yes stop_codon:yes gene_type:complete
MWKYNSASGTVDKITQDYVVVVWDDVNGYWHYTKEQAKKLEIVNESR